MARRIPFFSKIFGWPNTAWTMPAMVPSDEDGGGTSASSYGDAELRSFANAAVKVHLISEAYSNQMLDAQSETEKKQLEQRAASEMVQAVKYEGLSVDKYQAIAKRVGTDPVLAERVRQKITKTA